MLYALRRVKTNLYLDHLFEDTADALFQGEGLHRIYMYNLEWRAQESARTFAEELEEPIEVVEVALNPETGKLIVKQQGLVFGL